jgi:hypothetical protein
MSGFGWAVVLRERGGFGLAGVPVRGVGSSLIFLSQLGSEEPEKPE